VRAAFWKPVIAATKSLKLKTAKPNRRYPIERKRFREMIDFSIPNKFNDLGPEQDFVSFRAAKRARAVVQSGAATSGISDIVLTADKTCRKSCTKAHLST
jgi:hypothetical protein